MSEKLILSPQKAGVLYKEIEKRIAPPFTLLGDKAVGLRATLEDMFYNIPVKGNQDSRQLSGRMRIVAEVHNIPRSTMDLLHGLREYCNQPAHRPTEIPLEEYRSAVLALSDCIFLFSKVPIPPSIVEFLGSGETRPIHIPQNDDELVSFDRVEVMDVSKGDFEILVQCKSEIRTVNYTLQIRRSDRSAWYVGERLDLIAESIQRTNTLHLFNFYLDWNDRTRASTYYESMIVLEPDYIVDASDIGKCFFDLLPTEQAESDVLLGHTISPYEVIINKFFKSKANAVMIKGIILGKRFASYILGENQNPAQQRAEEEIEHAWSLISWSSDELDSLFISSEDLSQSRFRDSNFREPNDAVHPETTLLSPTYGFQGRVDFIQMLHKQNETLFRRGYEFKSGRNERPSDRMQAISYRTLIDAAHPESYKNSVALITLQKVGEPIHLMPHGSRLLRNILFARNRLVREAFDLARGELDFLKLCRDNKVRWPSNDPNQISLEQLRAALNNGRKGNEGLLAWHFSEFLSFLFRENIYERIGKLGGSTGGSSKFSDLWRLSEEAKVENGKVLKGLVVVKCDDQFKIVTFARTVTNSLGDFRSGDIVLILRGSPRNEKMDSAFYIRKGTIASVTRDTIAIRLSNPYGMHEFLETGVSWEIEKDFMEINFNGMLQSLFLLLEKGGSAANRFLGKEAPRFKAKEPELDLSRFMKRVPELSESQIKAIRAGLMAEDLLLIKGPPGTGKTSGVLTELVFQMLKTTNETIFLLAYTHTAVENIQKAISKMLLESGGGEHRIVNISSTDTGDSASLQYLVKSHGLERAQQMIRDCRIFAGTVSKYNSLRTNFPKKDGKNRTAIIDEASQITDPMVAGIFAEFSKVILIGDQNQLPPVSRISQSEAAVDKLPLLQAEYSSFSESVFQRLWRQYGSRKLFPDNRADHARIELVHHFRMHSEIADLVNPYYGGRLRVGNPAVQQKLLLPVEGLGELEGYILSRRIIFIESPTAVGQSNRVEAHRVLRLIQILRKETQFSEVGLDKLIGVISPWRRQVALIRDVCGLGEELRVDTVERFQGSERKNIILSLSTSNAQLLGALTASEYEDGPLKIDRKLNVSISRAEERLIILGDASVLDGSEHYRKLIKRIKDKGGYISNEVAEILFDEKTVTK